VNEHTLGENEFFAPVPHKIIANKNFPSIVQNTYRKILENPYYTLGEFLGEVNDIDLEFLVELAEYAALTEEMVQDEEDIKAIHDATKILSIIAIGLAQAEGTMQTGPEALYHACDVICMGVMLEHMSRAGLIEFKRENIRFVYDGPEPPLARFIGGEAE
jgi:hypothetical protein